MFFPPLSIPSMQMSLNIVLSHDTEKWLAVVGIIIKNEKNKYQSPLRGSARTIGLNTVRDGRDDLWTGRVG